MAEVASTAVPPSSANGTAEGDHLLSAAQRLWQQLRGEFEEVPSDGATLADQTEVTADDLKKVAKWLQHGITKFGATAAVTEDDERLLVGLKSIAEDVIKAFTAAIGTLLSLKRGAGASLLAELRTAGAGLAAAFDALGKSLGKPGMAVQAGKVLNQVKVVERTSTHNRAAIRRRLLHNLSQIRDAHRELQEALNTGDDDDDGDGDDDDDFGEGFDTSLEPAERRIVETLVELTAACVEGLKRVSTACMPPKGGYPAGGEAVSVAVLEAVVVHSAVAASAVDSLSVAITGGFDAKEFSKSLAEMSGAVTGLSACPLIGEAVALGTSFAAVEAAYRVAEAEDE